MGVTAHMASNTLQLDTCLRVLDYLDVIFLWFKGYWVGWGQFHSGQEVKQTWLQLEGQLENKNKTGGKARKVSQGSFISINEKVKAD